MDLLLDETRRPVKRTGENYALIFVFSHAIIFLVEDAHTPNRRKESFTIYIFKKCRHNFILDDITLMRTLDKNILRNI